NHFANQIVSFAGSLTDASENREASVLHCHVIDQFLDEHGLANSGPAEQTDLATTKKRAKDVDHLDAGDEHLKLSGLLIEFGRMAVDRRLCFGVNGAELIDGLTDDI